jgi:hypothetical protein
VQAFLHLGLENAVLVSLPLRQVDPQSIYRGSPETLDLPAGEVGGWSHRAGGRLACYAPHLPALGHHDSELGQIRVLVIQHKALISNVLQHVLPAQVLDDLLGQLAVVLLGVSPQAFSLTGLERIDGAEYAQSWLVT